MPFHSKLVLLLVTAALAVACSSSAGPVEPGIGGAGAAGGSDRPTINSDGGLGAGYDAPPPRDANVTTDAAVKLDAKPGVGEVRDASVEAGGDPELCSLLIQNCPNSQAKKQGCYPFGAGGSICAIEGDAVPGVLFCTDHPDCAAGAICSGVLNDVPVCVSICQQGFLCPGGNSCVPLQGSSTIGYCRP